MATDLEKEKKKYKTCNRSRCNRNFFLCRAIRNYVRSDVFKAGTCVQLYAVSGVIKEHRRDKQQALCHFKRN